jgi:hypothetical protein
MVLVRSPAEGEAGQEHKRTKLPSPSSVHLHSMEDGDACSAGER